MLVLYGKTLEHASRQGFSCFGLSIAYDPMVAIAVVLARSWPWRARQGSNLRPKDSKSFALSI